MKKCKKMKDLNGNDDMIPEMKILFHLFLSNFEKEKKRKNRKNERKESKW